MADFNFQQSAPAIQELLNSIPDKATKEELEQLRELYEALTKSEVIPVAESDWPVSDPQEKVIYRVSGTESYTDYMWNGTSFVQMATYDVAPFGMEYNVSVLYPTSGTGGTNIYTLAGAIGVLDSSLTSAEKVRGVKVIFYDSATSIKAYYFTGSSSSNFGTESYWTLTPDFMEANGIGGAYDISAAHSDAIYADLATALGTNGENVPAAVRKGGMSVKFITQVRPASYTVVKTEGLDSQPTGTELATDPDVESGTYNASQLTAFSTLPTSTGAGNAVTYWMEVAGDTTTYTSWVVTMVQSSDNKYVQFRYMGTTIGGNPDPFLDTTNWTNSDFSKDTEEAFKFISKCYNVIVRYRKDVTRTYVWSEPVDIPVGCAIKNIGTQKVLAFETKDNNAQYITIEPGDVLVTTFPITHLRTGGTATGYYDLFVYADKSVILTTKNKKISDLSEQNYYDLQKKADIETGKNLINTACVKENTALLIDGTEAHYSSAQGWEVTDFIEVEPNTTYCLSNSEGTKVNPSNAAYTCFYGVDKDSDFISYIQGNFNTLTTPDNQNVKYVRLTLKMDKVASVMLNKGSVRGTYYPYASVGKYIDPVYAKINSEIESVNSKQVEVRGTRNLLDLNSPNILVNTILQSNGTEYTGSSAQGWEVSDYIKVKPNTDYYLSCVNDEKVISSNGANIALYDENKTLLSTPTLAGGILTFTTPADCFYVRMSMNMSRLTEAMLNEGTERGKYEPYTPVGGYKVNYPDALPAISLCGMKGEVQNIGNVSNQIVRMSNWPTYIKSSNIVSVEAKITTFNLIAVGTGYEIQRGRYIKIDNTNVYFCHDIGGTNREVIDETVAHGLNIGTFIKVVCIIDGFSTTAIVSTIDGAFSQQYTFTNINNSNSESYGQPCLYADSSTTLTDVKINANCPKLQCPIWIFGDSMGSEFNTRWPFYTRYEWKFNYYLDALAGGQSPALYADLAKALQHGTPKYLVWMLGANDIIQDHYDNYVKYVNYVKWICESRNIELILLKQPSFQSFDTTDANTYMLSLGLRYVDFYKAVGCDTSYGSSWYPGYLSNDDVHPTELGAKAEASQIIIDIPEIMHY